MTSERESFERLLDVFDRTMNAMGKVEGKPRDFGTGKTLHRAEIHTVDAIGANRGINISKLAQKMGVTKGAISQKVSKLVKKGLVRRASPEDDAREKLLELTELGWTAYHNHSEFHKSMFDVAKQAIGEDFEQRTERLIVALEDLILVLQAFGKHKK